MTLNVSRQSLPTPEQLEAYHRNHEFIWISPDRKAYTGRDHAAVCLDNPDLFGFTKEEINKTKEFTIYSNEHLGRVHRLFEIALERGWIWAQINKLAVLAPQTMCFATFWFQWENPDVYDRITAFLKGRGVTNGNILLRDIMMRGWQQPVQSLYAKAQYSRTGTKGTCPRCGNEVTKDELRSHPNCRKCGMALW